MAHARNMSQQGYARLKADTLRAISATGTDGTVTTEVARVIAAGRARWPDLAAKADADARASYRGMLKELVAADLSMQAAHQAKLRAAENPSALLRERAATQFAEAVRKHDALLAQVESTHASLSPEAK